MHRFAFVSILGAALAACGQPIDTTRVTEPYASFGDVVYREACQRVAYTGQLEQRAAGLIRLVDVSGALGRAVCVGGAVPPSNAPPRLDAIVTQRAALVATVNQVLPKDLLAPFEGFLEQREPLADDGTMQSAIAALGDRIGRLADDPGFSPALSRMALRDGYRPASVAAGLVHDVVEDAGFDAFVGKTLALVAPGGAAATEWKQLLTAGAKELRATQPVLHPDDPERTQKLAVDLLTSRHPDLVTGATLPLVMRDARGLARAATVNGAMQAPFVDQDGDGVADADAQGRFVDAQGQPLAVPSPFPVPGRADTAPRDAEGRALTAPGAATTLYQYWELDGTVLGGLTRDGAKLLDAKKDVPLGLAYGMGALLGPRATKMRGYADATGVLVDSIGYDGFDTEQSPLLDLAHAFLQLLGDPNADQTFLVASTLLGRYESPTARLWGAALDASDRGKAHPEAQVPATSTVWDDFMSLVARILAVPGLADDLLVALEDPRTKDLAKVIARLMVARNQLDFDHTQCNPSNNPLAAPCAYPMTSSLDVIDPVDRSRPDSDYNRSLMQRIAHAIHDSNGLQYCNKEGATPKLAGVTLETDAKCKLFQIDDLALFFILSMQTDAAHAPNPSARAGADYCAHLTTSNALIKTSCPAVIEQLTGIRGFTQFPTASAMGRALYLKQSEKSEFMRDTTDDAICTDGDRFIDVHDLSGLGWEAPLHDAPSGNSNANFFTAIAPLADAFAKHDECVRWDANHVCTQSRNAAKILVDLISLLHEHWASPQSSYFGHGYQSSSPAAPRFAQTDDIVSYEPLISEILGQSDLPSAVLDLAPVLNQMTVDGNPGSAPARPVIVAAAKYLFQPGVAQGIAYRDGSTSTVRSDGITPVPVATPYYLIADAFAHKRVVLDQAEPARAAAWRSSASSLVDQFLTVERKPDGSYQLASRRFHAISLVVIDFLRGRLQAHAAAGDVETWVRKTLTQNLTDIVGGPLFAAALDLAARIETDVDARTQLYHLLQNLVDETASARVFQTTLTTVADLVQTLLDDCDLVPVARALGLAIDPTQGDVDAPLSLLQRAHDADGKGVLLAVLRNLFRPGSDGVAPASRLGDVLSEVDRAQPGHGGDLSGDDYRSIFSQVKAFLLDDQRGFAHFLKIVRSRGPG